MFADDAVLIARDAQQLKLLLQRFETFCAANDLQINTCKTCVMLVNDWAEIDCNGV